MLDQNSVLPQVTEYSFDLERMTSALLLIDENLGSQTLSILNFPRIRVPTGGGLNFRIQTATGGDSATELVGVITAWRQSRVFYHNAFCSGGNRPPDCISSDGITGVGSPGGQCRYCPHARFGSAVDINGRPTAGQACKDQRQVLFLLNRDSPAPAECAAQQRQGLYPIHDNPA
jgi:hypothetical protein